MTQDLKAAAGDEAALTARLLMLHALGEPDGALGARLNAPLDPATIDILSILTARRMAGEPCGGSDLPGRHKAVRDLYGG